MEDLVAENVEAAPTGGVALHGTFELDMTKRLDYDGARLSATPLPRPQRDRQPTR